MDTERDTHKGGDMKTRGERHVKEEGWSHDSTRQGRQTLQANHEKLGRGREELYPESQRKRVNRQDRPRRRSVGNRRLVSEIIGGVETSQVRLMGVGGH